VGLREDPSNVWYYVLNKRESQLIPEEGRGEEGREKLRVLSF